MLRYLFPCLFLAAIVVAGCGGGSVAPPTSTPAPAASISPGPTPESVTLTGAGYQLQFTLPGLFAGGGSLTATLQASPPSGVPVPALKSRSAANARNIVGSTATSLVYLVVQASGTVQFTSVPSFVFTLPSGTSIPSGSPSYVAFYDPTQQAANNGWIGVLGPGVISGQTDTFAGVNSGVTLVGGNTYVYALVYTSQAVPTATPAPTPTAVPSPVAAPAYCTQYQSYTPSPSGALPVPLNITDDSGLSATLVVYVENAQTNPVTYLTATGGWSTTPVSLPAGCFSTTTGSGVTGKPLNIPNPSNGRIMFAYAPGTPNPSAATAPNPLPSGVGTNPNYASAMVPWDKIEYTIPGGVIDTTQVDFLGLPLELSLTQPLGRQSPPASCPSVPIPAPGSVPAVVGFSSCGFLDAFNDIYNNAAYQPLLISQPFAGSSTPYALRVLSPGSSSFASFDWNTLISGQPAPSTLPCSSANTQSGGYLQCVLAYYQANPQVFTSNVGVGASGDWYCASSDGAANFIFTDVGKTQPASCPAAPTASPASSSNPFKLPLSTLTYGQAPTKDDAGCQYNNLFQQPYGLAFVDNQVLGGVPTGTGNLFSNLDTFAMWKALAADLNYGQAVQPGVHPGGQYPLPSYPSYSNFWKDPLWNYYAQVLHHYADGGYAYALAYDDFYKWSTSLTISTGQSINVRINYVPTVSNALNSPTPIGNPASCPTITPEIGTY